MHVAVHIRSMSTSTIFFISGGMRPYIASMAMCPSLRKLMDAPM